jgi:predicted nucleic acid-binding protein
MDLRQAEIDAVVEQRTRHAQAQLARLGHHRLPPTDLMLAAIADRHEHDVLHYDAHFDAIARHTDLRFESVWLAPQGSL